MMIPKNLFEPYKGDKSARVAEQPQDGRYGSVQVRRFPSGRHRARRDQYNLPSAERPSRPDRDEGRRLGMRRRPRARSSRRASSTGRGTPGRRRTPRRLEQGGKGRVDMATGGAVEHIQCNFTDPWKEVDGERSSVKTTHPFLSDAAVRARRRSACWSIAGSVHEQLYGRQGRGRPRTTSWADALPLGQREVGVTTSTRPTRSSTPPAGSGARTASVPRAASG